MTLQGDADGAIANWPAAARAVLLHREPKKPGWGYRPESPAFVEPTALASLAILATEASGGPEIPSAVLDAGHWLASLQQESGALGLSAAIPDPHWPTPYAVLLWHVLDDRMIATGKKALFAAHRRRAIDWIIGQVSWTQAKEEVADLQFGYDTGIPAWPWIDKTAGWVEPTSWAVLALCREGQGGSQRALDGLRFLRDRAIASGGWNSGNNQVLGAELRPRPAATGQALLALQRGEREAGPLPTIADKALTYLERELPAIRAPQSLCWGLLGLDAWGRRPAAADRWLAETWRHGRTPAEQFRHAPYLLLASSRATLSLLGISRPEPEDAGRSKKEPMNP